jgi:DNA-binding beta-propeller fold protein YncE
LNHARTTGVSALAAAGSSYACLGVSVSGADIGDAPGLQCGHPGVVAGPLQPSITSVDLLVPAGPARTVIVFGITDAGLCSTFDAASLNAAKLLGSSKPFDFFDDTAISVTVGSGNVAAFPDCSAGLSAPIFQITEGLAQPSGVAIDSINGFLYVANGASTGSNSGSISKYNLSTGTLVGSIGNLTATTGNCPATGAATSWCTGGTFTLGSGDGMFNQPQGLFLDATGTYLYVSDTLNNRISKVNASTGAFLGWIGNISTSPTGGAAGCIGATAGTFTPGWCTGGTATNGSGDGMLYQPHGLFGDSSGNLYVSDMTNNRISKYNSAGCFQGWIGKIFTSPTGGASGCNGAAAGTFTPGWCTGGGASYGSGDGMLYQPHGLFMDSSAHLYVADSNNHRISKYSSAGSFQGWIGNISTSPTGGAAGCAGATTGSFTPGWCTGGTATNGSGDGMLYQPQGLFADSSSNLYVADSSNHRISKYNALAGTFLGSIGNLSSSTGSCPAFGPATSWCSGGTFTSGTAAGEFTIPTAVAVDPTFGHLFVTDNDGLQRLF